MCALVFYLMPTLGPTGLASSIALSDLVSIQRGFRRSRASPVTQENGGFGSRVLGSFVLPKTKNLQLTTPG